MIESGAFVEKEKHVSVKKMMIIPTDSIIICNDGLIDY